MQQKENPGEKKKKKTWKFFIQYLILLFLYF